MTFVRARNFDAGHLDRCKCTGDIQGIVVDIRNHSL